ncbi:hypothetical protein BDA96_01G244100 [Sorghum bicolor]|uniref:Uncharacterized protein n=2 Tax=Sorghum bicolor TaxID=4558 RepID=A0A921UYB3_SORBI|nr:hypothetical protein BDA96_01G244100 [Sorghum bicolor]KXG38418.1 hypothetical protein SORBI_3001G229700 [Sorghum bicolor]
MHTSTVLLGGSPPLAAWRAPSRMNPVRGRIGRIKLQRVGCSWVDLRTPLLWMKQQQQCTALNTWKLVAEEMYDEHRYSKMS